MASIYDYFTERLGRRPDDETLKDLPLDSGCGDDCMRAIDAARVFLDVVCEADRSHGPTVVVVAEHVVSVFWHG